MTTWHVSPRGSDRNSGGSKDPFGTIQGAIQASRTARKPGPRRIEVHGGNYFDSAVELTPADSGLRIKAADGARPVLHGGRLLTGWQKDGRCFFFAPVPGARSREWDFRSLIVNGRLAPRARLPEEGKLTHESRFTVRWMSTTKGGWERKPTAAELGTMRIRPGDLPADLDVDNLEITVYHSWDESMVGVRSYDPRSGRLVFRGPAGHPPGAFAGWKPHCTQYVAWNVREGMTRPGQWYLDRTRERVVYWPLRGENMARAVVMAPVAQTVLRLNGSEEEPLVDVDIEGLTISATTTPLISGGFGALRFDGAIHGVFSEGCRLANLHVRNVAGQGIVMRRAQRLLCERCVIEEAGAGGLVVSGGKAQIRDNLIHHNGRIYPSGIGLRLDGERHRVEHNELHHTTYSAIAGGGTGIRLENNLFHHVMEELVDGAAIYLFAAKQCVVKGNYTHSVREEQVHAYYLDEQSADSVVEGNLAVDVPWALHNHMASRCVIRDNLCVSRRAPMTVSFPNCDGFLLQRNVFYTPQKLTISGSYTGIARLEDNVFYSGSGHVDWSLHDRRPSLERNVDPVPVMAAVRNSVLADPRFRDPDAGDWRFRAGSPATARGIRSLDGKGAGRRAVARQERGGMP